LFSTIHYKDHGGFKEFLEGVWKVLPEGTPLIGGTVSSFMNNYGCFSRGATALAVSYPNIDIALGVGNHTKRSPKAAATQCAKMINKKLKNSKYKNRFLINFISGPTIPFGKINVVKNKISGWIISHLIIRLFSLFETGIAKEEDVIECLARHLPDYNILGGSTTDIKLKNNYQFVGKEIYENSIVALGCTTDCSINLDGVIGGDLTDKSFEITGMACNNRVITKINDKPAKDELFKVLDFSEEQFKELELFYTKTTEYLPITFDENRDRLIGIIGLFGSNVVIQTRAAGKTVRFVSATGKEAVESIRKNIQKVKFDSCPFIFGLNSAIYVFMLGEKTFEIKSIFDEKCGDIPYLMVQPIFENIGFPGKNPSIRTYSSNMLTIGG
jgi:hypothetical protein